MRGGDCFIINSLEISQKNKPSMASMLNTDVAITVFSVVIVGLCALILIFNRLREKMALQAQVAEAVASQEIKEEKRRERKESLSNGLIVKEWMPDAADPPVESTEGAKDTLPPGETVVAPQPAPGSQINSSPASCAIGSDDCESLDGEEEEAGCAICLCHFKLKQLVCESSNSSSCQHVFHKDCMVDWLMKDNHTCPMCRQVYLPIAV
jgi:hypothetical protein